MTQYTEELMLTMEYCALVDRCQTGGQSTHFGLKSMGKFEELVLSALTHNGLKEMVENATK